MTMDPTTESIAHFIGLFELRTDELRLRQDYLEFRLKKTEQEMAALDSVEVRLQAPYTLLPYEAGLDHTQTQPDRVSATPTPPVPQSLTGIPALAPATYAPADLIEVAPGLSSFSAGFSFKANFSPTPPGSLVSVTLQKITLNDNDLFVNGSGIDFVDPEVLLATLEAIVAQGEALSGFAIPDLPVDGNWMTFAEGMLAAIDLAGTPDGPAEVSVIRGSDAAGVFVDGVAVAEAPIWTDLLPLYLRPQTPADGEDRQLLDAEATDGETVQKLSDGLGSGRFEALDAHDFGRDFDDRAPDADELQTGHKIVAGANTAINEIALYSKWLDASVFVVLGDVARIDAISQVNVLVEHDTIDGVPQAQPSLAKNVAAINTLSSADPTAETPVAGVPAATSIARLDADLIQVNWVKQFTFVTDFDRADVVFSGSSTYLGLGENQMVNSAVLNEFGYIFDLIFVTGDMVDATIISQKNVLFDSDQVITTSPAEAGSTTVPAAFTEPEHFPEEEVEVTAPAPASVVAADEPGIPVPPAEISQNAAPAALTAIAEPAPLDDIPNAPTPPPPNSETDVPPAFSLADNLLLNEVAIERTGVDEFVEMKKAFREAAEGMRDGAKTLPNEVAADALFGGMAAVRALQIDGDLARINLFEQTNIVGDADQIRLEIERLREELGAEAELIAGSNALINRVSIIEDGIDSKIMAAQNVYSDALIHQAGLFDADSVPTGVAMSSLSKEAVAAFIVKDVTGPTEIAENIAPTGNYEAGSTADVMQTMLG